MAQIASNEPSSLEILLNDAASALGENALETIPPPESASIDIPQLAAELPEVPSCITQLPVPQNLEGDPSAIMIGLEKQIPRWVPGSTVRWTAWRMGYQSQEDADYASYQMDVATKVWNDANVGVTFEHVQLAKDANFALCHGGAMGSVLASAYFPNEKDLNFVYVYSMAFSRSWKQNMWSVFVHELGHVLGLRHEFAMDLNETGKVREGTAHQLGEKNPLSVMNYRREPPQLQPSDISSTQEFYKLENGFEFNGTPIVDFEPR